MKKYRICRTLENGQVELVCVVEKPVEDSGSNIITLWEEFKELQAEDPEYNYSGSFVDYLVSEGFSVVDDDVIEVIIK